jgi:biotin-(acetyl-CoA carboxylase) ligase
VLPRLLRLDALRGQRVANGAESGVAAGIDEEGRLLVRDAAGRTIVLESGEVHLLPAAGA